MPASQAQKAGPSKADNPDGSARARRTPDGLPVIAWAIIDNERVGLRSRIAHPAAMARDLSRCAWRTQKRAGPPIGGLPFAVNQRPLLLASVSAMLSAR